MLQNYSDDVSYSCHRDVFCVGMKLSENKAKEQDPVGQKVCGNSTAQPPLPRGVSANNSEQVMVGGQGILYSAGVKHSRGTHVEFLWNRKLYTDRGFG